MLPMKILEYVGLDTSRVKAAYRKVADAIARSDFRSSLGEDGMEQGARPIR